MRAVCAGIPSCCLGWHHHWQGRAPGGWGMRGPLQKGAPSCALFLNIWKDSPLTCPAYDTLASLPMQAALLSELRGCLLQIGWRRVGWAEFFRTAPSLPSAAGTALDAEKAKSPKDHTAELRNGSSEQRVAGLAPPEGSERGESERSDSKAAGASTSSEPAGHDAVPPAEFVQPLLISKLNTVLQLGLIAGCISHSWYDWPTESALWGLGGVTAGATLASFAAYVQVYRRGQTKSKN